MKADQSISADEREKLKEMLFDSFEPEFARIGRIRKHVANSDVYGKFVETVIRRFVRENVTPLRCLTGSIVWPGPQMNIAPQIDTMLVWPTSCVPLFAVDDFAIVPRDSCHGVLEIKSSTYKAEAATKTAEMFKTITPAWVHLDHKDRKRPQIQRNLAVFCIGEGAGLPAAKKMGQDAVILMDDQYKPQPDEIMRLVDFLVKVRNDAMACHDITPRPEAFASNAATGPQSTNTMVSYRLSNEDSDRPLARPSLRPNPFPPSPRSL